MKSAREKILSLKSKAELKARMAKPHSTEEAFWAGYSAAIVDAYVRWVCRKCHYREEHRADSKPV